MHARATLLFVSYAAWWGCKHDDPGTDRQPHVDARPPLGAFGSIDIDDGTPLGASLHVELLKETSIRSGQEPEQTGWILRGTDAANCDDTSISCISLQLRLPLSAGVGPHTCGDLDTELELLVNLGSPYYYYKSAAGDTCTFELSDDGQAWVSMQHLDLTMEQGGRTVHVTGEFAGEIW